MIFITKVYKFILRYLQNKTEVNIMNLIMYKMSVYYCLYLFLQIIILILKSFYEICIKYIIINHIIILLIHFFMNLLAIDI